MLHPSYSDLMTVINARNDDINLKSRYSIIIAAAKRARQLVDEKGLLDKKAISVSVEELYQGKINIKK
ncbi:DNA-directed RNA polymerase subunit omega [Lachnospiraceae bacterium oral taxon 500]|nr:DNA-directed RNA polymerase subunit omega [Lachnospiraceae bacterium oral taxon 500]